MALCGSRHLTSTEVAYSAVEGEALSVAWCLRKARLFLLRCLNLILVTDHRPMVGLFKDRALGDITNPRLYYTGSFQPIIKKTQHSFIFSRITNR